MWGDIDLLRAMEMINRTCVFLGKWADIKDIVYICHFYFVYIYLFFIYLFLAALGLCCCMPAFSICGKQGLLFIEVCGLLIVVASLVVEHGL